MYRLALILALLISSTAALAGELRGVVSAVSDGDTIHVLDDTNHTVIVRLANIDAPETTCHQFNAMRFASCVEQAQRFGKEAKSNLLNLIGGKEVRIVTVQESNAIGRLVDTASYGRTIGTVYVNGINANLEQLRHGFAWFEKPFAHQQMDNESFAEYANAEEMAKAQGIGLWSDKSPLAPWRFRHSNSKD